MFNRKLIIQFSNLNSIQGPGHLHFALFNKMFLRNSVQHFLTIIAFLIIATHFEMLIKYSGTNLKLQSGPQ